MRTKRRLNRLPLDSRKTNASTIKTMLALLKRERHQYQIKVAELEGILGTERNEINSFLKDMQAILIDLERQRTSNATISTPTWNMQNRNVRIFHLFELVVRFLNVYLLQFFL